MWGENRLGHNHGYFEQKELEKEYEHLKGVSHLLSQFNQVIRKFMNYFNTIEESHVAESVGDPSVAVTWNKAPLAQSMDEELVTMAT